jgi:hypothetical protein
MSSTVKRKRNPGIVLVSKSISTNRSEYRRTITEVWGGPIAELETKQNSVANTADSTNLTPTEGGNGTLTIETSQAFPALPAWGGGGSQTTIEIEWVELRKKLQEHPRYAQVSDADRRKIEDAIANPKPDQSPALTDSRAIELYTKLLRGQTEYSLAVPVVRRTTTRPTSLTAGNAWFRNNPPVSPSGWQWLKTADRISRTGNAFQRVEEWTGAKEIDTDIYP